MKGTWFFGLVREDLEAGVTVSGTLEEVTDGEGNPVKYTVANDDTEVLFIVAASRVIFVERVQEKSVGVS